MTHSLVKNYFCDWTFRWINSTRYVCNCQKIIVHIHNAGKKNAVFLYEKQIAVKSKGSSHVLWRWDLLSKPFVALLFATSPVTLSCADQKVLRLTLTQEELWFLRRCHKDAHLHVAIHFLNRLESERMSGEKIKHFFKFWKWEVNGWCWNWSFLFFFYLIVGTLIVWPSVLGFHIEETARKSC